MVQYQQRPSLGHPPASPSLILPPSLFSDSGCFQRPNFLGSNSRGIHDGPGPYISRMGWDAEVRERGWPRGHQYHTYHIANKRF